MPATKPSALTSRNREVAGLLAKHMTLKEIAAELGITESAVNQQVATLKRLLGASSRYEIVNMIAELGEGDAPDPTCRKPADRISTVGFKGRGPQKPNRNDAGLITLADAGFSGASIAESSTWQVVFEPRIVPKWLDGDNAITMRLLATVGLLLAMLLLPIIGVASLDSVGTIIHR